MNGDVRLRDGRVVTLALGVTPDVYAELEARSSRANPVAWCVGCGGKLYFQHHGPGKKLLYGYHFPGQERCEISLRASLRRPMTDAHKGGIECHAIAMERAGIDPQREVMLAGQFGRSKPDLVAGNVGWEIQHSGLQVAAVRQRTARQLAAGLEMVMWASDASVDPPWIGRVPGYRYDGQRDWRSVPDPSAVGVLGVQDVQMERFDGMRNGRYFERWRPRLVAKMMTVEDIVAAIADASVKPASIAGKVRLITRKGDALWRGHTGSDTTWTIAAPALRPTDLVKCDRPATPFACTCDFGDLPAFTAAGHRANHEMFGRCYQIGEPN